ASFAGLVCARTAALRGLKVAVLEAKQRPGARIHTTGILVKEATEAVDIPARFTRKIRGVRLYTPRGRSLDLHAPGYFFQATDTAGLLDWLGWEAQAAGADLFCRCRFEGAERDGEGVRVSPLGITGRYLVGADGARSRVAEAFGLGTNRDWLVGMEAECHPSEDLDPRFLHCLIDSQLAPGYLAWAVPGLGVTQVGLATRRTDKPDLAAVAARFGDLTGLTCDPVLGRRSGRIPCGGLVSPFATQGVCLTGDAAGLVSPLTGGGIRLAFHFGRRMAQVVGDYLEDRGPDPGRVMAQEYPRFRTKVWMRKALSLAPPNGVIEALFALPPMRRLAASVYFHRRGVPGASPVDPALDGKPEPGQTRTAPESGTVLRGERAWEASTG
ncbi:MAG: FAD-dependent monooxygenase, partial [Pseudomonadota bacterium]